MMDNGDQVKPVLQALETMFELQLRSVRQLLGEEEVRPSRRRDGKRRSSLVDCAVRILEQEGRPLHLSDILELLRQRFGRVTDRDTLSSALAKKARAGVLLQKTAPATFALLRGHDHDRDHRAVG